jgi:hypothetical protein
VGRGIPPAPSVCLTRLQSDEKRLVTKMSPPKMQAWLP